MEVKVKNGNLDMILSGTLIVNSLETTFITLSGAAGEILNFSFIFETKNDQANAEPSTLNKIINDTLLEVTFVNFFNPFGIHAREHIKVGSFENRELYFQYFISAYPGQNIKVFQYTFYLGEVVNHG
jgi:hypothetical protein